MEKLTWQSRDGQHALAAWVEIGIGGVIWHATVDGRECGGCYGAGTAVSPAFRAAGVVANIGRVALTADRYAALCAEAAALKVQYRQSPEGLRGQRRDLGAAIRGAVAEAQAARERAFQEDIGGIPSYDTPKVRAAHAALAAFDEAHPGVVAALAAAKAADADRHAWD